MVGATVVDVEKEGFRGGVGEEVKGEVSGVFGFVAGLGPRDGGVLVAGVGFGLLDFDGFGGVACEWNYC